MSMNSVRTFSRLLTPLSLSKICYFVKKYRFLLGNAHSTYVFGKIKMRFYLFHVPKDVPCAILSIIQYP